MDTTAVAGAKSSRCVLSECAGDSGLGVIEASSARFRDERAECDGGSA
jgi:hypothetical protein